MLRLEALLSGLAASGERPFSTELCLVNAGQGFWLKRADGVLWTTDESFALSSLTSGILAILPSLIQCTLMSTPRIESGRIRLMKVIDFRLLQRTGRPELPEEMLSALSSEPWREPMGRFFTLLERDFGLPNPLGRDPFYCARVDHVVRHRRPVLTWRLRTWLAPPADWGRFLCAPREWIFKGAGRIAQSDRE